MGRSWTRLLVDIEVGRWGTVAAATERQEQKVNTHTHTHLKIDPEAHLERPSDQQSCFHRRNLAPTFRISLKVCTRAAPCAGFDGPGAEVCVRP